MVRRRKNKGRRKSYFSAKTRRVGRKLGGILSPKATSLIQPDAMTYGAVRQWTSNKLQEWGAGRLPGGELNDELAMGLLNYGLIKYVGVTGFAKNVCTKGLVVENARVGEYGAQRGLGGITSTNSASAYQVYG